MINFKVFLEEKDEEKKNPSKKFIQLDKGFIPPKSLGKIIEAFGNSSNVEIMSDTSKEIKLSKKALYLCGGSVRDFLTNKTPKEFHLVTDATPVQMMHILNAANFYMNEPKGNIPVPFKVNPKKDDSKEFELIEENNEAVGVKVTVDGMQFNIHTLNEDPKTGSFSTNFTNDLEVDAEKRDMTINALYIELSKPDGENNKLFDPTNKGWHDIQHGIVRMVGSSKDRLSEDPTRALRAMRFQSKMSKNSKLDDDLVKSIKDMSRISPRQAREELMKSLSDDDIDIQTLIKLYKNNNLTNSLFANLDLNQEVPESISRCSDPHVKLSWILKNNPSDNITKYINRLTTSPEGTYETGWEDSDREKVLFFVKLDQLNDDNFVDVIHNKSILGISPKLIDSWIQAYNLSDSEGLIKQRRPAWANKVKAMTKYRNFK